MRQSNSQSGKGNGTVRKTDSKRTLFDGGGGVERPLLDPLHGRLQRRRQQLSALQVEDQLLSVADTHTHEEGEQLWPGE